MVNVAIAGGTGGVGRALLETLTTTRHKISLLTRKKFDNVQIERSRLAILEVDYSDQCALVDLLDKHQIHTVICTFGITPSSLRDSQANLMRAATKANATERFIPSSFAIPYPRDGSELLVPLQDYFAAIDFLRSSKLEWTVVHNGIFLDYYLKPESKYKSYLSPNTFVVDVEHCAAAIPGTGDQMVTFTYTYDVARFVAAMLDLPKGAWPQQSNIIGDEMTWHQFVELAQEGTRKQFTIVYDDKMKLERFQISELPGHKKLYGRYSKERYQWFMSIFELWTLDGKSHLARSGSLNEMFPEIETLTWKRVLEDC